MKKLTSLLLIIIPVCVLLFYASFTSGKKNKIIAPGNNTPTDNIAVLELFTSQGCSSCPPADRLLGKYITMPNVIGLSFHVDYWNRLGWTDPFSSEAFSQRQKEYAGVFKLDGVYTPQLVINGEKEMVGSDENKLSISIKKVREDESNEHVIINAVKVDGNKATINCTIQGRENNAILNIALVQNKTIITWLGNLKL